MKTEIDGQLETCLEQLLDVLDRDIAYLEDTVLQLNNLRRLVVKQDAESLQRLLDDIRTKAATYQANELKRSVLRRQLGHLFNCAPGEITLSRLENERCAGRHIDVTSRKNRLHTLVDRLKKEYAGTQALLADCARFNRLLLKGIFAAGRSETMTYQPTGTSERQTDSVFVNLKL